VNVTPIQSFRSAPGPRTWTGPVGRLRDGAGQSKVCDASGYGGDASNCCPPSAKFTIQPPWRVLPWPKATGPVIHRHIVAVAAVNQPLGLADVTSVGRTLDLFV
jgi:hypothetical protein